jgi:hypothetical protein
MQRTIRSAKHFPLFAVFIALTLPLSGPTVLAQAPETTDTTLQQALAPLTPGTTVRISRDLSLVEGSLQRLNRHDLVLNVSEAEQTLSLEEVDTLWVSRRGRAGKGALIGGLAGLGIGLLTGAIAAPEGATDTPKGAVALAGAGAGALAGAFLGLLVGAEVRYWERAYPGADR